MVFLIFQLLRIFSENQLIILRVPILYGPVEYLGEGALVKVLQDSGKPCKMDDTQKRYPTHVASVIAFLVAKHYQVRSFPQVFYFFLQPQQLVFNPFYTYPIIDSFPVPILLPFPRPLGTAELGRILAELCRIGPNRLRESIPHQKLTQERYNFYRKNF